ncbi:MAG TPA: SRPBCC domain-containing protein [Roseiflexaceae bacterium]|nr:SRPBCC domain-containing protein [Roseiflexaceae bacterium]
MPNDDDRFLRISRRFEAAPERVFDAWLDPAMVRRWLFTMPTDEAYTAELDARVGGQWRITARRDGIDYTASGEYLQIDRPRRLAFTFEMLQFSPNTDRVTVDIAPDGDGCVLTLTQKGVDIAEELRQLPADTAGDSEAGWRLMFDALQALLSR